MRLATLTVTTAVAVGLTGTTGFAGPTPVSPDRQLASDRQQLEAIVERYDAARDQWRATNARLAQVMPVTCRVLTVLIAFSP